MNIFELFENRVRIALGNLTDAGHLPAGLDFSRVVVEPPRDHTHGDLATNAAMVLAREAVKSPRVLAELLVEALSNDPDIEHVSIAGPGFINLKLRHQVFERVLRSALDLGSQFGRGSQKAERVNVEYVSANPTGPMHVGHGRGATRLSLPRLCAGGRCAGHAGERGAYRRRLRGHRGARALRRRGRCRHLRVRERPRGDA